MVSLRLPEEAYRQEIWADQMSYHHDNLMVGLGENRRGMVTEIWGQNGGVQIQAMSSLSFVGSIRQSELRDLRNLNYRQGWWFTAFESNSLSCVSLGDIV